MSEITENTFTSYLGPEFQQNLMWQILVEPEFAEKAIPSLSVEYFDDPNLKRLYLIVLSYIKEFGKVPNLQNQSILQAIAQFKSPNNTIEEETLYSVIKRIEMWNERILNKEMQHNGDVIQASTNTFVKQQEYRKLGEFIIEKTKSGEIKSKNSLGLIEDRIQKISLIGDEEDDGTDVTEGVDNVLRKEFRQTIPTGVTVLDAVTGGGLGKGEIGIILTPSGVGKTTLLTVIANTAREQDKNVLQIIFEDTEEQIKRKHFAIWSKTALSKMDDDLDGVREKINEKVKTLGNKGRLTIKRFSQEDTTMKDIISWIKRYQKKHSFKFDIIVLDYLDCLDSHKKTQDRNEAELVIIKSFEAMAGDFNIPCWSAIQSNRSGFDAEHVEANQSGGNIKRVQKAHFFMSVAKTPSQKEASLANIRIIKARFAQDGQTFNDCIFNNDTMKIDIRDDKYGVKDYPGKKKYDDERRDKFAKDDDKLNSIEFHSKISEAMPPNLPEENISKSVFDMSGFNATTSEFENDTNIHEMPLEELDKLLGIHDTNTTSYVENEIIEASSTEASGEMFVLDETEEIQSTSDSDLPTEVVDEKLVLPDIGWNGESGNTETNIVNVVEVKIEDLPSKGQFNPDNNIIIVESSPPVIEIIEIPIDNRIYNIIKSVETQPKISDENKILEEKPKENKVTPEINYPKPNFNTHKNIMDLLKQKRVGQEVIIKK